MFVVVPRATYQPTALDINGQGIFVATMSKDTDQHLSFSNSLIIHKAVSQWDYCIWSGAMVWIPSETLMALQAVFDKHFKNS